MKKTIATLYFISCINVAFSDETIGISVDKTKDVPYPGRVWVPESYEAPSTDDPTYIPKKIAAHWSPQESQTVHYSENENYTIPGQTVAQDDANNAAVKNAPDEIASVLDDANSTIDDALTGEEFSDPNAIAAAKDEQAKNELGLGSEAQEKKNAVCVSDPVRITVGTLVTSEDDLKVNIDGLAIGISRRNASGEKTASIYGDVWAGFFSPRLIWGEKSRSNQIVDEYWAKVKNINENVLIFENVVLKRPNAIDLLIVKYTKIRADSLADADRRRKAKISEYKEVNAYLEDRAKKSEAIAFACSRILEGLGADPGLIKRRADFEEKAQADYRRLLSQRDAMVAAHAQAVREREQADAIRERNRFVLRPEDPDSLRYLGNDKLVLVDEQNVPHVFSIQASAVYSGGNDSPRAYYPLGSALRAEGVFLEKVELLSDGRVRWERKNKEIWTFDPYGRLERREDPYGNYLSYRYEGSQLASIADKRGRTVLSFAYEGGLLSSVRDLAGRTVSYRYAGTRLVGYTDANGDSIGYEYDERGHLSAIVKPDGSRHSYHYAQRGDRWVVDYQTDEEFRGEADAAERGTMERFDYHDGFTDYVTPLGGRERHYFDARHRETRVEYPDGTWVDYTYDDRDLVVAENRKGVGLTRYEYDAHGNRVLARYPDGSSDAWLYDDDDRLIRRVDRHGGTTAILYENGRPRRVDYPDGTWELFAYRADGKVDRKENSRGLVEAYSYDEAGYLSRIDECDGSRTATRAFRNDAIGRPVEAIDPAGVAVRYAYYPDGSVKRIHYDDGRVRAFAYDNRKDLVHDETRLYAGLDGAATFALPESRLDEEGSYVVLDRTTIRYDRRHNPLARTNVLGERVEFSYRASSLPSEVRIYEKDGTLAARRTNSYDAAGRLVRTELSGRGLDEAETEELRYDQNGRLAYAKDGAGTWRGYAYDPYGAMSEVSVMTGGTDPASGAYETEATYVVRSGRLEEKTDADRVRTRYEYDGAGRVREESIWRNGTWRLVARRTFADGGRSAAAVDALGRETLVSFDAWGRPSETRDAYAAERGRPWSRKTEYDGRGLPVRETDAAGLAQQYEWDGQGRLTLIVESDPAGNALAIHRRDFSYRGGNLVVRETDPRGNVRETEHDPLGRPVAEKDANGGSRTYEYDALGKTRRIVDASGRAVERDWDAAGRLREERSGSSFTRWTYDGEGRVLSKDEGGLQRAVYAYDPFGRMTSETKGEGALAQSVRWTYDRAARTSRMEAGAFSHAWTYDESGRLASERDGLGAVRSFSYDAAGRVQAKTEWDGSVWTYAYDAGDRPLRIDVDGKPHASYSYDDAGRMVSATNDGGTLSYDYDLRGRVVRQEGPAGEESYAYDAAGNRTAKTSRAGTIRYDYGRENELLSIVDDAWRTTRLSYDAELRPLSVLRPDGSREEKAYDESGRLSYTRERGADGGIAWAEAYVYDGAGRASYAVDEQGRVRKTGYDVAGRLAMVYYPGSGGIAEKAAEERRKLALPFEGGAVWDGAIDAGTADRQAVEAAYQAMTEGGKGRVDWYSSFWKESYSYDAAGNRARKATPAGDIEYAYDGENRLRRAGNRLYRYDAAGNLIEETTSDERIAYGYGKQNRVESYTRTTTGKAETETLRYEYDALSRRQARIRSVGGSESRTRYAYEGRGLELTQTVAEATFAEGSFAKETVSTDTMRWRPAAGMTGTETNRTRYAYAGSRIVLSSGGAEARSYGVDRLGSVRTTRTLGSASAATYDYDAFGESLGEQAPELFGYTGQILDPSTGDYDYGYRDYAPRVGRFSTVDPIKDGTNWYAYVGNDPVNFTDPDGLESADAAYSRSLGLNDISTNVYMTYVKNGNDALHVVVVPRKSDGSVDYTGIKTKNYHATNNVKTPEERKNVPVEYNGYYYFPEQFPNGTWEVESSKKDGAKYIGPIKIPTNAMREVPTYELGPIPDTWVATGQTVKDEGYLLHSGEGNTTWGCIKLSDNDISEIAGYVDAANESGGRASLTVKNK